MPNTKLLINRGTKENLDLIMNGPNKLLNGELAYTTDTKELYVSDGTSIHLIGSVLVGDANEIPTPQTKGRMFTITDGEKKGESFVDTGTNWIQISSPLKDKLLALLYASL